VTRLVVTGSLPPPMPLPLLGCNGKENEVEEEDEEGDKAAAVVPCCGLWICRVTAAALKPEFMEEYSELEEKSEESPSTASSWSSRMVMETASLCIRGGAVEWLLLAGRLNTSERTLLSDLRA